MLSNSCSCCCCSARLGLWFTRRARRGKKWCFHRSPAGNSVVCWVRLWSIWWKLEMWRENKFADSLQAIARFILLVHRCKMGVEGIRKLMKGGIVRSIWIILPCAQYNWWPRFKFINETTTESWSKLFILYTVNMQKSRDAWNRSFF